MKKLTFKNLNIIVMLGLIGLAIICVYSYAESWVLSSEALLIGNLIAIAMLAVSFIQLKRARLNIHDVNLERESLALLVQNSSDLIAISNAGANSSNNWNPERSIRYINKAGRRIVGIPEDAPLESIKGSEFYSPADNERMKTEVFPAVISKGFYSGEFRYRHQVTGEAIPVEMNIYPLTDHATGEVLGMAAVSKDLRDRKNLQQQLDSFFEVSLDMLGIANTDGYFLKLNPAFTEILGYSEAELCSRPAIEFIHPDDVQSTLEQLQAQADGRSVFSFENRYRTKDGDYRWFSWKSSPRGKLTYGAARDITDEKIRQSMLSELSQKAIAASRAKSEFLANMSHEIRTPINGVVGMTSLLLDSELSAEQRDYADNIRASAETLLSIVNDILDFSKVEAGKIELEELTFDLEQLINETAKSISYAVRNKSIPFTVNCEHDAKSFYSGDPGRIRQVLNNLLSNAVKFTDSGSIALEVKAVDRSDGLTKFKFSVKDSGIGLSREAQTKLFQAFTQADASTTRRFGGTGLGLSISKRLVELMGGEIGVDSTEGQGSTFWFTVILRHASAASAVVNSKALLRKSKHVDAQILVAEDNFVNQKILLGMLAKIGLNAQAVANGNEVLSMLRERRFDLILMDCQMPELDGYETTRKIRESRSLPQSDIPVIAMTANALKGDREKCLEAGMNDYASKPIAIEELARLIEKWLDQTATAKSSS